MNEEATPDDPKRRDDADRIVGIGASAGGLSAVQAFLGALPDRSGMAFVLLMHQPRDHPSLLPSLLAHNCSMQVAELTEGSHLEADHVYVVPPGRMVFFHRSVAHIDGSAADAPPKPFHPIDGMFRSLANDYLRLLRDDEQEAHALVADWLIGVTRFFREPDAFAALATAVDSLLEQTPDHATVRVWVPACSTGEEAYSVTIVIQRCIERRNRPISLQVFATDINPDAIEFARAGRYPLGIAQDVPSDILERYFHRHGDVYRPCAELREQLIFAVQDCLSDPPYTRMDVIACRNLLIYLERDVQQKLIRLLHYALNPDGLLLLGNSETLGEAEALFSAVSTSAKLFRWKRPAGKLLSDFPIHRVDRAAVPAMGRRKPPESLSIGAVLRGVLADEYGPPTVLVDRDNRIVHVFGSVSRYMVLISFVPLPEPRPDARRPELDRSRLPGDASAQMYELAETRSDLQSTIEGLRRRTSTVVT